MISDVRKRELDLNTEYQHPLYININQLYSRVLESYNPRNIDTILKNWQGLEENKTLAFAKVLDLFEEVCLNGNIGDINKTTSYIIENIIPKVRDAAQMQYHIKRKIGNIKTKITTKATSKIEDLKSAIGANIAKISAVAKSPAIKVPSNNQTAASANNVTPIPKNTNSKEKDEEIKKENTIINCSNKLLQEANNMIKYDRIISNHNKLCKRFNIDRVVRESVFTSSMVSDCVIELCKLVDTYTIPISAKYSICLENSLFALDKNGVPYNRKDIVNSVSDYFLMNYNEKAEIPAVIKRLADTSSLFKLSDFEDLDYVISKSQANKQFDVFFNRESETFSVDMLDGKVLDKFDDIEEDAKDVVNKITTVSKNAKNKAANAVADFKMLANKTPEKLKETMKIILTDSDDNIFREYPGLLKIIFSLIVIGGTTAISPILGAIAAGTTYFISMKFQRERTKKFLNMYKKNKEHAENRLKTLKTEDSKDRCRQYISQLDKDIHKIQDYYDSLLTDDEKYGNDTFGDDDLFKGLDNMDDMKEAVETLAYTGSIVDYINKSEEKYPNSSILKDIDKNIAIMDCKDLDVIKEFSLRYPEIINPSDLAQIYSNCLMETRKLKSISKYIKIDCLNENIDALISYKESDIKESNNILEDLFEIAVTRDCIKEYFDHIKSNTIPINEMNYTNTINLLIERVKNSAIKLSDSEKIMSKTLDSSLETLKNSMENALTQENREAVIRGRILPPVSKILKLTLTAGAVSWLIHPAIAVIGLIGIFSINKNLRDKERQIIMDELDVELTMTDKYIRIAEERNQMKNLRNLLMIKKKLEAQRNRLKYKMEIEWKTPYNPSSSGEDNAANNYNDDEY